MEYICELYFEREDQYGNLFFKAAPEFKKGLENIINNFAADKDRKLPVFGSLYKIKFTQSTIAHDIITDSKIDINKLSGHTLYCKLWIYNSDFGGKKYTNINMRDCFTSPRALLLSSVGPN